MGKKTNQLCVFCGADRATTRDHVPPKGIFNKPWPSDLITVPCCLKCNNGASKNDEKFKAYLGMHVARFGGEAEKLFKEGVLRTTNHNRSLRQEIIKNTSPVYTTTKSGIITGKAKAILWDSDAHDKTIERITKGLFYHHFGKILPKDVLIDTFWFKEPSQENEFYMEVVSIAKGAFIYRYAKTVDTEYSSIWFFEFYGGHFAGGITVRKDS